MELGKLKEIDVRKIWAHEQYNFSTWLAEEKNIQGLGDELNLSLVDVETEKFVGSYRCDILCKDEITGKTVLIENQLEKTNHDHLGKLITYASGLDAAIVVWIVSSVREEHASAIAWLNKNTTDNVAFFLIEVHAYKIGDSMPAPLFKIIEQPNDFVKQVTKTKDAEYKPAQIKRMEFWNLFNDYIMEKGKPFNTRKASTDNWYDVAVGSSLCHIAISLVNKENRIRVEFLIPDNKDFYNYLTKYKEEINRALPFDLIWYNLDNLKASSIYTNISGLDYNDNSNYRELFKLILDRVLKMREVFKKYLNNY